jgi:hypothetical protein
LISDQFYTDARSPVVLPCDWLGIRVWGVANGLDATREPDAV